MSGSVTTFPGPRPRITPELLCQLTARVTRECDDIKDIVADYTLYCVTLGVRPSGRVHYDWAMERLGMTQHKALA